MNSNDVISQIIRWSKVYFIAWNLEFIFFYYYKLLSCLGVKAIKNSNQATKLDYYLNLVFLEVVFWDKFDVCV